MERMRVKRRSVGSHRSGKNHFSWLLATVAIATFFPLAHRSYARQQTPHAHADADAAQQAPARRLHTITVRFDYDFNRTPPCSATASKLCVQQFVVYDVSLGPLPKQRTRLFTVPVPPNAKGAMRNIKQVSPPLDFAPGRHMISVTAQTPDENNESSPTACTTWIKIP